MSPRWNRGTHPQAHHCGPYLEDDKAVSLVAPSHDAFVLWVFQHSLAFVLAMAHDARSAYCYSLVEFANLHGVLAKQRDRPAGMDRMI